MHFSIPEGIQYLLNNREHNFAHVCTCDIMHYKKMHSEHKYKLWNTISLTAVCCCPWVNTTPARSATKFHKVATPPLLVRGCGVDAAASLCEARRVNISRRLARDSSSSLSTTLAFRRGADVSSTPILLETDEVGRVSIEIDDWDSVPLAAP